MYTVTNYQMNNSKMSEGGVRASFKNPSPPACMAWERSQMNTTLPRLTARGLITSHVGPAGHTGGRSKLSGPQ